MNKQEIIDTALNNIRKNPGLDGLYVPFTGVAEHDTQEEIHLEFEETAAKFNVIVKNELRTHQVEKLITTTYDTQNQIFIIYRLYPGLKKLLLDHHINYIEANGNVFIKGNGMYVFVDGHPPLPPIVQAANRAFTQTGLKVLFALLNNKNLINETQRVIAEKAGVALGNIPNVIKGLKETGHLINVDQKTFAFTEPKELLYRWLYACQTTLKPALKIGRFKFRQDQQNWKQLPLNNTKTVWGGEPAGELLTDHLRAEALTIYTTETKKQLLINYGIMPDPNGYIHVYQKFWDADTKQTAPPVLVFADLMHTQDKRCIETANRIFHEWIEPTL